MVQNNLKMRLTSLLFVPAMRAPYLMEIDAAGMKIFIPTECFIPAKLYISVWVLMDAILLRRQGTKLALGKIS
jgi:hypothetical protein